MGNQAKIIRNDPREVPYYGPHLQKGDVVYVKMTVEIPDVCGEVVCNSTIGLIYADNHDVYALEKPETV